MGDKNNEKCLSNLSSKDQPFLDTGIQPIRALLLPQLQTGLGVEQGLLKIQPAINRIHGVVRNGNQQVPDTARLDRPPDTTSGYSHYAQHYHAHLSDKAFSFF